MSSSSFCESVCWKQLSSGRVVVVVVVVVAAETSVFWGPGAESCCSCSRRTLWPTSPMLRRHLDEFLEGLQLFHLEIFFDLTYCTQNCSPNTELPEPCVTDQYHGRHPPLARIGLGIVTIGGSC
eukprot:1186005-Amphidinium_carterae.1